MACCALKMLFKDNSNMVKILVLLSQFSKCSLTFTTEKPHDMLACFIMASCTLQVMMSNSDLLHVAAFFFFDSLLMPTFKKWPIFDICVYLSLNFAHTWNNPGDFSGNLEKEIRRHQTKEVNNNLRWILQIGTKSYFHVTMEFSAQIIAKTDLSGTPSQVWCALGRGRWF